MNAVRLTKILLPLLAARSRAPWLIELQNSELQRALEQPRVAASGAASWRDHQIRRAPFDDVQ